MITWKRLARNRKITAALTIIALYVLVALLAPVLSPPDDPDDPLPYKVVGSFTDPVPHPPSAEAILGTIPGQFDVYHSLIWGARSALGFGLTVTVITSLIGTLLGAVSGYVGGRFNRITMRVTDAFLAFPPLVGVLLFQLLLTEIDFVSVGNQFVIGYVTKHPIQSLLAGLDLDPIVVTLILFSWMGYARLINANVLQLKQAEFVMAARSIGAGGPRIIWRHLLPSAISPVIVLAARDIGGMVILKSAFAFIGTTGSYVWSWGWGEILVEARNWIVGAGGNPLGYWWVFIPATIALVLFSIGWNLLGNGLNDVLNPYQDHKFL